MASLEDAIDGVLSSAHNAPFAVFDFDNTCIVNDVAEATLAYLCEHDLLKDRTLLGERDDSGGYHERVFRTYHKFVKDGRLKAAYILCMRMFSGYSPGEAEAATLTTITGEGNLIGSKMLYGVRIKRGLAVRRNVLALMDTLRTKGVGIWIVSASPESAVRATMTHFGIDARLIGARGIVRNGIFTSALEEPLPMFEGKVACVRKYVTSEHAPLLAAGDSKSDLPMLETAEIKVVVDRGSNELAQVARERDWFLL